MHLRANRNGKRKGEHKNSDFPEESEGGKCHSATKLPPDSTMQNTFRADMAFWEEKTCSGGPSRDRRKRDLEPGRSDPRRESRQLDSSMLSTKDGTQRWDSIDGKLCIPTPTSKGGGGYEMLRIASPRFSKCGYSMRLHCMRILFLQGVSQRSRFRKESLHGDSQNAGGIAPGWINFRAFQKPSFLQSRHK